MSLPHGMVLIRADIIDEMEKAKTITYIPNGMLHTKKIRITIFFIISYFKCKSLRPTLFIAT